MDFWETEYDKVRLLSRENAKRFGKSTLLREKKTGDVVVLKETEKKNTVGYQQLINESEFSFSIEGLPQILKIHETEDRFFIIKAYCEGITLSYFWAKVKRSRRKETLLELVNVLSPIFQHLEENRIVHSDIKPENILVNEKNGHLQGSLIDFGLAFRRDALPERKTLFQLAYAPPELILNRLDCADSSADVFSFCLIVYKLWTGKLPFQESNPALMTQLQITYPISKPWKINRKLWKVLEKGLTKHVFQLPPNRMKSEEISAALVNANQHRYPNFKAFKKALEQI